jgi:multidrug transporter EmrE-like cation transporter
MRGDKAHRTDCSRGHASPRFYFSRANIMSISGWLALMCAGICAAVASILLKAAASSGLPLLSMRVMVLDSGALAAYGMGILLYAYCLRYFQVGVAYVCMVAVAAILLFSYSIVRGEPPRPRELVGAAAVLLGVFLIASKHPG